MKGKKERSQLLESKQESNQENSASRFLDVRDIAVYLKVRVSTVYSMVEQRAIPHYRVGRQIRFKKSEVDEWMAERKEDVIDVKVEAKKVIRSLETKPALDIDRITKKAIDEAHEKRYTSDYGKPDRNKGLGKEVEHGSL